MSTRLRFVIALLIAVLAGVGGLLLLYTDIGPGDVGPPRAAMGAIYFLGAGFAIGAVNPRGRGWWLAGIAAWTLVVIGAVGVRVSLTDPASADMPLALLLLVGPVVCSLIGGRLGARMMARGSETPAG